MKCNLTCLAEHYIVKGEFGHHSLHTLYILKILQYLCGSRNYRMSLI